MEQNMIHQQLHIKNGKLGIDLELSFQLAHIDLYTYTFTLHTLRHEDPWCVRGCYVAVNENREGHCYVDTFWIVTIWDSHDLWQYVYDRNEHFVRH